MAQSVITSPARYVNMLKRASEDFCSSGRALSREPIPGWPRAFTNKTREYRFIDAPVVRGELPPGLKGSFIINGPGLLRQNETSVGHWLDGDAGVLQVTFEQSRRALASYRLVETKEFKQERDQGRYLYVSLGNKGELMDRLFLKMKMTPNINVLPLHDRVLVLGENTMPYALKLGSLTTIGSDSLGSRGEDLKMAAHYKKDPLTGHFFTLGIASGSIQTLMMYHLDGAGTIVHRSFPFTTLQAFAAHDLGMSENKLVVITTPTVLDMPRYLVGAKTLASTFASNEMASSIVLIYDKQTMELEQRIRVPHMFASHYANAFEPEPGIVTVDFVRYDRLDFIASLYHVHRGISGAEVRGAFVRMSFDISSGKVLEDRLLSGLRNVEFPVIPPESVGFETGTVYMNRCATGDPIGITTSIVSFNARTSEKRFYSPGKGCYVSETQYATDQDDPTKGWILTLVYDSVANASSLHVLRADRIYEGPVCELALPYPIPPTLHGTWTSAV